MFPPVYFLLIICLIMHSVNRCLAYFPVSNPILYKGKFALYPRRWRDLMPNSKRHYRVAERTKETENAETLFIRDTMKELSILGLIIYLSTVCLSFALGYLVGKTD